MTQVILIEKNGSVKQTISKDVTRDNLYKKCGFKKNDNFEKRTSWNLKIDKEKIKLELWAKNDGKAGMENKYEFPPPIDKELYFGTCIIIRIDDKNNIINLTSDLWLKSYDILFGGFEDIEDEEEESEDEMQTISKKNKTKSGYLKDNFVVDDDEEDTEERYSDGDDENDGDEENEADIEDEDEVNDEDNENDDTYNNYKNKNNKKSTLVDNNDINIDTSNGVELEEEAYSYSD